MTALRAVGAALRCEWLKARRSKVPPLVAAGFSLAPVMAGLFMVIMQDPERAARWGLVRMKAEIFAGAADWPTFIGVLAQAVAVGGLLLFSLVVAWVFGREFADRTVRSLLAVPAPRWATVVAKMIVAAGIGAILSAWVLVLGLGIGAAIRLEGGTGVMIAQGAVLVATTALLTIGLITPVAFLAGVGRGYLAPLGFAILTLFLAQIMAATGWGDLFPWSVPALHSGLAGPEAARLAAVSYLLVALVSLAGLAATIWWWRNADHTT